MGDQTPVIFLSGYVSKEDVEAGLKVGRAIYIAKGEGPELVLARIDGVLGLVRSEPLRVGALVYHSDIQRLELPGGDALELKDRQGKLFEALATRPFQLVPRKELRGMLWRPPVPDDEALTALAFRLRTKLGEYGWMIRSEYASGYRLITDRLARADEPVGRRRRNAET